MAVSLGGVTKVRVFEHEVTTLIRARNSPFGRDLEARALRVTRRMKAMATGIDGGPNIDTHNLQSRLGLLRIGQDAEGLYADIGVNDERMIRRGWNYAYILEGPDSTRSPRIELIGGQNFGEGARRPFMARSLLAAGNQ